MITNTMLPREAFDAARRLMETTARPLEIARFRQAFDGESGEGVLAALKSFQNSDGGFGRALEPDLRTGESSALCTTLAFQVLRATGARADNALVSAGISYLLATLNRAQGHWRIIPRSAELSPHAPWWNQTGREEAFARFPLNPTAEILGYLYDYQQLVPGEILAQVSDRVIGHLSGLEQIEMHDLLCCLRLFQTANLPATQRAILQGKLTALIDATVANDPAQWAGYSLRPLQVVDDPASPFMAGREALIATNLDYEISTRNADGSWTPTWTWGDAYPDDWAMACREWTDIITLEKLLLLKRFGRIDRIG